MGRKRTKFTGDFPMHQKVEMVATRGKLVKKKIMTYGEAIASNKVKGWDYSYYQVGYCSIIEN